MGIGRANGGGHAGIGGLSETFVYEKWYAFVWLSFRAGDDRDQMPTCNAIVSSTTNRMLAHFRSRRLYERSLPHGPGQWGGDLQGPRRHHSDHGSREGDDPISFTASKRVP
jgi:hypothetical protein